MQFTNGYKLTKDDKKNIIDVAQSTSLSLENIGIALKLNVTPQAIHTVLRDANVVRKGTWKKRGRYSKKQKEEENDDPMGEDLDNEQDEPVGKKQKSEVAVDDSMEESDMPVVEETPYEDDSNESIDDKEWDHSSDNYDYEKLHSDTGMERQDPENVKNQEIKPYIPLEELDYDEPLMDPTEPNMVYDGDEFSDDYSSDSKELQYDKDRNGDDMNNELPLDHEEAEEKAKEEKQVKLYLPERGEYNYINWTADQVYKWTSQFSQFLPDNTPKVMKAMGVNGEWLFNLLHDFIPLSTFGTDFRKSLDMVVWHLQLVIKFEKAQKKKHLLLENNLTYDGSKMDTQDPLNTVCQLMFSCKELRDMVCERGLTLDRSDRFTSLKKLAGVFVGDTMTTRSLRFTFPEKLWEGPQMLGRMFKTLIESLKWTPCLDSIRLDYFFNQKCENCRKCQIGRQVQSQQYTCLEIENNSFLDSLEATQAKFPLRDPCKCGGTVYEWQEYKSSGKYHIFLLDYNRTEKWISDLDFNSEVEMFGAKWKILSFAEKRHFLSTSPPAQPKTTTVQISEVVMDNTGGQQELKKAGFDVDTTETQDEQIKSYVSWIRSGDEWTCIADDKVLDRQEDFADLDVRMLVFEKIE